MIKTSPASLKLTLLKTTYASVCTLKQLRDVGIHAILINSVSKNELESFQFNFVYTDEIWSWHDLMHDTLVIQHYIQFA